MYPKLSAPCIVDISEWTEFQGMADKIFIDQWNDSIQNKLWVEWLQLITWNIIFSMQLALTHSFGLQATSRVEGLIYYTHINFNHSDDEIIQNPADY